MLRAIASVFMLCILCACTAPLPENTVPLNRASTSYIGASKAVTNDIDVHMIKASSLQAGDEIRLSIEGEEDISGLYKLDENGIILLPLIDEVNLTGLSLEKAARLIAARYQDGYLLAPEIIIEIVTKGA